MNPSLRMMALGAASLLLASPASASRLSVLGSLVRDADLAPGERTEGEIQVRNNGDEPLPVIVYQTDYRFQADGSNEYGNPGSTVRSNAGWIEFSPHQFIIPPGETVPFQYTMTVPSDASLDGTYWSVLMVAPRMDKVWAEREDDKAVVSVNTVFRYGIQMVTNVGEGDANLSFAAPKVEKTDGRTSLQVDLQNTGEAYLAPTVWTDLFTEGGGNVGRFEARKVRLYPDCSGRFRMDLGELPEGRYTALVVADNGDEHVFGSQYTLDLQ